MHQSRIIRRHQRRTDDGKGLRRLIAGRRFRLPSNVTRHEADQRFLRLEELWRDNERFCERIKQSPVWTYVAIWAAESIKKGELRVSIPPLDEILASYGEAEYHIRIKLILDRYIIEDTTGTTDELAYPATVDGLSWDEAQTFYDLLCREFPSVNWILPDAHRREVIVAHEMQVRDSLSRLAAAKGQAPPNPDTPLVVGTLHESLQFYQEERRKHFLRPDGTFDSSGHHMVGMIADFIVRLPDCQLAELDFARCQSLFDFWRDRPMHRRKGHENKTHAKKTCQNYIGELKRFFDWLHLCNQFGWRKPDDFSSLRTNVRSLPSDRKSIGEMPIGIFSLDELTLLYKYALPSERLLLVWCLNCAHGAAEFGRVEWEDIFLDQKHPWQDQGLRADFTVANSWCGLIRPKTDVLGWWWLWPETVQLIKWWQSSRAKILGHQPDKRERVLVTANGGPLYRDDSRNAQSGFSNTWNRLLDRIEENEGVGRINRLPFGTLRNQLPDWLGGDEAKALIASVALCHGIPHKGDRLLFKHYSNRPWIALFDAQRQYREQLGAIFASVEPLAVHDPVGDEVAKLWTSGMTNVKIIATYIGKSADTVRRRIKERGLLSEPPKRGRPRKLGIPRVFADEKVAPSGTATRD